jgi:hypothetical protein
MLKSLEKCQKNPKKFRKNSHGSRKCPKWSINSKNIEKIVFLAGKIRKNSEKMPKIPEYI